MPPALSSPGFLVALAVLLANDLWWKAAYGNWLTGKLSDFAGLFVVVVLAAAFRPGHGRVIAVTTAAVFTLWKSPLSQPLIDAWNVVAPYEIARVVDVSDLLALTAIPAATHYAPLARPLAPAALRYPVLVLAVLAILGTSKPPPQTFPRTTEYVMFFPVLTYETSASPDTLVQSLRTAGFSVQTRQADEFGLLSGVGCATPRADGRRLVDAQIAVWSRLPRADGALVHVRSMNLCRQERPWDRDGAAAVFEAEVLALVGGGRRQP